MQLKVPTTQPLLENLLDKCSARAVPLTAHEVTILELCLSSLTPAVAGGFLETFLESSDTHKSFQLLLRALSLTTPLGPAHPSPLEIALRQVMKH